MPRKQREEEPESELDLIPIMNLVLILIPLLLLSVVFLEITVINVTMPQKSFGPPQNSGEPPKRLQLMISKEGFWLIKGDRAVPTIPECSGQGAQVTVCLKDPEAPEPVDKYNWLALYNELMRVKAEQFWEEHDQVEIVAGSDINFSVLVKAMDVSRYQRVPAGTADAIKGTPFSSSEEFEASDVVLTDQVDPESGETVKASLGLFRLVVLGLPTTQ